mmetsp:Transcript_51817/g.159677  ORF Transcript_51817/g.159677 Transcript_51817/m.159677 type:complete len:277 (-) Transcript_51817:271-1101(-)
MGLSNSLRGGMCAGRAAASPRCRSRRSSENHGRRANWAASLTAALWSSATFCARTHSGVSFVCSTGLLFSGRHFSGSGASTNPSSPAAAAAPAAIPASTSWIHSSWPRSAAPSGHLKTAGARPHSHRSLLTSTTMHRVFPSRDGSMRDSRWWSLAAAVTTMSRCGGHSAHTAGTVTTARSSVAFSVSETASSANTGFSCGAASRKVKSAPRAAAAAACSVTLGNGVERDDDFSDDAGEASDPATALSVDTNSTLADPSAMAASMCSAESGCTPTAR